MNIYPLATLCWVNKDEKYISHSYWKQIYCLKLHTLFYKEHFYKKHQAEIGKKLGKS